MVAMKTPWKVVLLVLVVGAVWLYRGGESKAPDEKLARHLSGICKIAKANANSPVKGVKSLFHFMGHHSSSMMKEFGDTLILIERIADDEAHDQRAREAGKRIQKPFKGCERDLERFVLAIENDEEASALMQRGSERLGRTLELIFDPQGSGFSGSFSELLAPVFPTPKER